MPPEKPGPERYGPPPFREGRFTPAEMWADNRSAQAQRYLSNWQSGFTSGSLAVLWRCSDSRFIVPAQGVSEVANIATAPMPGFLLTVPGSVNIVMNHEPCGGRSVKKVQEEEGPTKGREFSSRHVENWVYSSKADWNGDKAGWEITEATRRPTLVATQHHSTGRLEPVSAFIPHTDGTGLDVHLDRPSLEDAVSAVLQTGHYGPEGRNSAIYEALTPIISPFVPFLTQYSEAVAGIPEPDESKIDPTTVLITTEFAGLKRFPTTLGAKRKTVFTVTVPPIQPDGRYAQGHIENPFDQLHYPITHALENKEQNPKKPFARLANGGTLLLESNNLPQLMFMINEAYKRPYLREWEKNPNNTIYCLLTNNGALQMEPFEPAKISNFFINPPDKNTGTI
jgi:hypothetical protein